MRRMFEVFLENVNTSGCFPKSLFSSLPLPPAARGLFLKKPPVKHLDPRKNFCLLSIR